ncbi:MAG TPA: phosphoglucosamine mutase [Bacteroidales bacterium]|nr:phosphoglucosamine mutase [Bacteroidales bacterium]HQQ11909.1 phosphoglucosamine mutase [Bacteroidales bacterium]
MTLIKSISGIRGTIGGSTGSNLTPLDIVQFTAAFGAMLKQKTDKRDKLKVVVGRDARVSGEMVNHLVCGTLMSIGADVFDLGLSTTPTVEMAVTGMNADGGIILTASHNPAQWNALKLLNEKGEFISASEGEWLLEMVEKQSFDFVEVDQLGSYQKQHGWIDKHIQMILDLPLVDTEAIRNAGFKIAVDAVNSTGGIALPQLLNALGVEIIHELYCSPNGHFPHNPEPLPEHLTELSALVKSTKADLGLVVDPDVDRLAIVDENGNMFGEEYTLVAVADYILSNKSGNTVSNLSSTRALADVTAKYGTAYYAAAVGEVNVVEKMKAVGAVIGGEGNGGIIYPELHYGRDALVGIALFLTHLAKSDKKCSELRQTYPAYFMSKNKLNLTAETNVDQILASIAADFANEKATTIDGVKIDFAEGWVHLRKSNTEPIIRVYSEGKSPEAAQELADKLLDWMKKSV